MSSRRYSKIDQKSTGPYGSALLSARQTAGGRFATNSAGTLTSRSSLSSFQTTERNSVRKKTQQKGLLQATSSSSSVTKKGTRETSVDPVIYEIQSKSNKEVGLSEPDLRLPEKQNVSLAISTEYSPPRLLIAQDLRGEKSLQASTQPAALNSPRIKKNGETAFIQSLTFSLPSFVESLADKGTSALNSSDITSDSGYIFTVHQQQSVNGAALCGLASENGGCINEQERGGGNVGKEDSRSSSLRRASGPVVTEEWSRSIVKPEDEHLLYMRGTFCDNNYEENARNIKLVQLRNQTGRVTRKNAGEQRRALTQEEMDGRVLEKETEAERTIRMNERQIRARGTLLLFSRPSTRLLTSNRSTVSDLQRKSGVSSLSDKTAVFQKGMEEGVGAGDIPAKHYLGNNFMVTSILQPKFGSNERLFSSSLLGAADVVLDSSKVPSLSSFSDSKNMPPTSCATSPLSPSSRVLKNAAVDIQSFVSQRDSVQKKKNSGCNYDINTKRLPSQPPLSLFSEKSTHDTLEKLFADPFFALSSDENCERLLLTQEEHDARKALLLQHNTSIQHGQSMLSSLLANDLEGRPRPQCKCEVSVNIMHNRLTAQEELTSAQPPKVGNVCWKNGSSSVTPAGKKSEIKHSASSPMSPVFKKEQKGSDNHNEDSSDCGAPTRYFVSWKTLPSEPAKSVAKKTDKKSQQRRGVASGDRSSATNVVVKKCDKNELKVGIKVGAANLLRKHDIEKFADKTNCNGAELVTKTQEDRRFENTDDYLCPLPLPNKLLYMEDEVADYTQTNNYVALPPPTLVESLLGNSTNMGTDGADSGAGDVILHNCDNRNNHNSNSNSYYYYYNNNNNSTTNDNVGGNNVKDAMILSSTPQTQSSSLSPVFVQEGSELIVEKSPVSGPTDEKTLRDALLSEKTLHSKLLDTNFLYNDDEPDAELYEYVQFAWQQQKMQCSVIESDEGIAHTPGVLWLLRKQRKLAKDAVKESFFKNSGIDIDADKNNNCKNNNSDNDTDSSDSCLFENEVLLAEEVNHYAKNANCVLKAFGQLWDTPFYDSTKHDTLPYSVKAQLLLFTNLSSTNKEKYDDSNKPCPQIEQKGQGDNFEKDTA